MFSFRSLCDLLNRRWIAACGDVLQEGECAFDGLKRRRSRLFRSSVVAFPDHRYGPGARFEGGFASPSVLCAPGCGHKISCRGSSGYRFRSRNPCNNRCGSPVRNDFPNTPTLRFTDLGQRQLFPLPQQILLDAQRFGAAFQQRLHGVLDGVIEAAGFCHGIDQAPGERGRGVDIFSGHHQPAGAASADQARQQCGVDHRGMPTRTSGRPNIASCAATRTSRAAATSRPPPRHQPGRRAITGAGNLRTASQRSRRRLMKASRGCLIERRHLLDVGAADHAAFAFAGQDHRADAAVGGQMLKAFAHPVGHGRARRCSACRRCRW